MEAAAAAPHLLHCGGFGRVAHLPALHRCRRRGHLPRVRAVATEPKPSTSSRTRPKEIQRVRKQMEEDEQLASLMRDLRGQNLRDEQFADDHVRLRLVEVLYESEEYSSDEEVSDEEFEMYELHGLINDATADIFEIMEDHIRQMRTEFRFRLNKMYNSITGYLMTKAKKPTKAKKRLSRIH